MSRRDKNLQGREYRWEGWEDLRFPASTLSLPALLAATWDPDHIGYTFANNILAASRDRVHCLAQVPHSWHRGSVLKPHVHWQPTTLTTGTVIWELQWEWANAIGGVFPYTFLNNSIVTSTISVPSQWTTFITEFADIDTTDMMESAIFKFKIIRRGDEDGYAGSVLLDEFDIHYLIGKPGTLKPMPEV